MSSSMKDIFYHALLARAAYANLKKTSDDNQQAEWDKLLSGQSAMTESMAKFIQDRFEVVDSSLNNDLSFTYDPLSPDFVPTWNSP